MTNRPPLVLQESSGCYFRKKDGSWTCIIHNAEPKGNGQTCKES